MQNGILKSGLFEGLPLVHGFTTRRWGNLGFGKNPVDPEVSSGRRNLFHELQLAGRKHVQPRQIHSGDPVDAREFVPGMEADASFTSDSSHLLSVLTADCLPILVYHPDGMVSAIHAGWRGLYNDIIPRSLAHLPRGCITVIGPAIGPCCYEVGEDLAVQFEQKYGPSVVDRSRPKPHLDLLRTAVLEIQEQGVEHLEAAHLCTHCHPDLFFSYRRDGSSGRMMSFIGLL